MKKSILALFFIVSLFCSTALAQTYSTNFPLTENPVSEGGNWINGGAAGINWQNVKTIHGIAFGTQNSSGGYDDSTAVLTGTWGPDQTVTATVYSINQRSNYIQEVELRLRTSISANSITGYEVLFRCSPGSNPGRYIQIVRWNGPLGDFSYVNTTPGPGIINGDRVMATISGLTITVYVNNVQVLQGTDSTYSFGSPGIGFYTSETTANSDFGFTDFTATGSGSQPFRSSPSNYILTLLKSGTGKGTVSSSPNGNACGSTCSSSHASYASGTVVTLTAKPDANSLFAGWSGACSGVKPCIVNIDAAKTITATFEARKVKTQRRWWSK